MNTYPVARRRPPAVAPTSIRLAASLAGGMALFLIFILSLLLGGEVYYSGRIYPGVSVAGYDLTGLTEAEAATLLSARLSYPNTGQIVFQWKDLAWAARPSELGLLLDPHANARSAYELGRRGGIFRRLGEQIIAWHSGKSAPVVMTFDQRAAQDYLSRIAVQVNRPTVEAALSVSGLEVTAAPGQVGYQVNIESSLAPLENQLRSLTDGIVALEVIETPPLILDASGQAEAARQIVSTPLSLSLPDSKQGDPGPWTLKPEQLAAMLKITRTQAADNKGYLVALDGQALYEYLTTLAGKIDRGTENARFMFNDDTRKLELIRPAVIGRSLDVYGSIRAINEKVAAGEHTVPLALTITQPEVGDTATGEQLGITEQITAYTSHFRGSSGERMQNIQMAAANFHGLLIAPGAEFSMASAMGNVSLDTGYAEAWIIFGGKTIKGVGGGVCQVSTTLFRAAFFAGLPITERYPHAYRVGYYEQTGGGWDESLAGLDATVFVPMVDFKFINDTPYWLLMETYFHPNSRTLTWKFYSTSDGRSVQWETTGPQNIVEAPDPTYEENPELAPGEIVQVDWAAEGADVNVTRTVTINGQTLFTDAFATHYLPWADAFQYGPGTQLPKQGSKPWKTR